MANLYDQYLYKPTNKEQLGLGIGSLISAALASMGGNNTREALIRGAAGGLAGYGTGWKGMQDQYGEVIRRAMEDRQLQNQEQSMAIKNAMDMENQGLRREQFEANKPLIKARIEREPKTPEWLQKIGFRESSPENAEAYDRAFPRKASSAKEPDYLSKMEKIDTKIADLEFKDLAQSNPRIQASINSLRKTREHYYKKIYGSGISARNLEFDFNEPTPNQQIPQQGDVMSRHQNDPAMQGTELGKLTPQGYEVYKNGKLVGHYQ